MNRAQRPAGRHEALLYRGAEDYAAAVGAFIRAGLAAGEPVLAVLPPRRREWIARELGPDLAAAQAADAAGFYQSLGRATRDLTSWIRAQAGPGRPARVVADPELGGRPEAEIAAHLCAEAAATVFYRPFPVRVLCPFPASLPADVLADARRTHPELSQAGGTGPSPGYTDPGRFILARSVVSRPPKAADSIGFAAPGDLSVVRRFLRVRLAAAGLAGEAAQAMVAAVGEVVTNALAHGGPPRRLWIYRDGGRLVCHVQDGGTGPADPLAAYLVPDPYAARGQGLWLARQLAYLVELATDPTGTHVRVMARLSRRGPAAAGRSPAPAAG
jgi:anti-sigma regulatory factor (Ser/Thr protein kinase)